MNSDRIRAFLNERNWKPSTIQEARMAILCERQYRRVVDLRADIWFSCACWREERGDDEC